MAKEEIVTRIDTSTGEAKEQVVIKEDDSKLDIEVQDDAPKKDRGRKPLEKEAELAKADDDAVAKEIEQYDENTKRRIKDLRHAYHDERRAKEAALREREEAINLVKKAFGEVENVRKRQEFERQEFIKQLQDKVKQEIEAAKRHYKQAYEAGNADEIVAAQEMLSKAHINEEVLKQYKVTPPAQQNSQENPLQQQNNQYNQQQFQQQARPAADPQAEDWASDNPWFGQNKLMTSFAFGLHEELISKGINPVKDADRYYAHIDKVMREKFPEYEWEDASDVSTERSTTKTQQKRETKTATVVAPVQRTTRGTKVTLTTSQVSLAKRLGLSPEQYARELVKLNSEAQ